MIVQKLSDGTYRIKDGQKKIKEGVVELPGLDKPAKWKIWEITYPGNDPTSTRYEPYIVSVDKSGRYSEKNLGRVQDVEHAMMRITSYLKKQYGYNKPIR